MPLNLLWATMRFITRLPVPEKWAAGVDFQHYGRGVPFFPLIGGVVGLIAGSLSLAVSQTGGGVYIGAIVYVLALAVLTGGFHLDGLADTCDGVFSARSRERMLEIMRDSRLGTHGGLALIFCILLKIFAVIALSRLPWDALLMLLICAPVAGRAGMVLAMHHQRYAREGIGMGNIYIGAISLREAILTLLTGAVIIAALAGIPGLMAIGISYVVTYWLARGIANTLGGQTGDTLGAVEEVGEILFLLAMLWV